MLSSATGIWSVLVIFCITRGHARTPETIVGGSTARFGEFPQQVSLRAKNRHFCGGCIINEFHILTTASCVLLEPGVFQANIAVLSGSIDHTDTSANGRIHNVSIITIHENYDPKNLWINDIAVLTLTTSLIFSTWRRPIALPDRRTNVSDVFYTVGWGSMVSPDGQAAKFLQKIMIKPSGSYECDLFFESYHTSQLNRNCGKTKRSGVASAMSKGDGGGPMFLDNQVLGLLSFSDPAFGNIVIYTEVYPYVEWISNIVAY